MTEAAFPHQLLCSLLVACCCCWSGSPWLTLAPGPAAGLPVGPEPGVQVMREKLAFKEFLECFMRLQAPSAQFQSGFIYGIKTRI